MSAREGGVGVGSSAVVEHGKVDGRAPGVGKGGVGEVVAKNDNSRAEL